MESRGRDSLCYSLYKKNLSSAASHLAVTREDAAKVLPVKKKQA